MIRYRRFMSKKLEVDKAQNIWSLARYVNLHIISYTVHGNNNKLNHTKQYLVSCFVKEWAVSRQNYKAQLGIKWEYIWDFCVNLNMYKTMSKIGGMYFHIMQIYSCTHTRINKHDVYIITLLFSAWRTRQHIYVYLVIVV